MGRRPSAQTQRERTKVVEQYLEYINSDKQEWHKAEVLVEKLKNELGKNEMSWVKKLQLTQKVVEAEAALGDYHEDPTPAFVEIVLPYSRFHGIDKETWKRLGVPEEVLEEAGWQ